MSVGGHMASAVFAPSKTPAAIPVREILPWAVFGGLLCFLALYFVGAEQGATSIFRVCIYTNSSTTAATS
jgi:hypothetical protein